MGNFDFIKGVDNDSLSTDQKKELAESFNRAERLIKFDYQNAAVVLRQSWEKLAKLMWSSTENNDEKIDFHFIREKLEMDDVRIANKSVDGKQGKLRLLSRTEELATLTNDQELKNSIINSSGQNKDQYGLSYFIDKKNILCCYDVLEYIRVAANYGAHDELQDTDDNLTKFITNITYEKMLLAFKYTYLLLREYVFAIGETKENSYDENKIPLGRYEIKESWGGFIATNEEQANVEQVNYENQLKAEKYYLGSNELQLRKASEDNNISNVSKSERAIIKRFHIAYPDETTQHENKLSYTYREIFEMKIDRIQYFSEFVHSEISCPSVARISDVIDKNRPFVYIAYTVPKSCNTNNNSIVPLYEKVKELDKSSDKKKKYCYNLIKYFMDIEEKYSIPGKDHKRYSIVVRRVSPSEMWIYEDNEKNCLMPMFTNFEDSKTADMRSAGQLTAATGDVFYDTTLFQVARILAYINSSDHFYYSGKNKKDKYTSDVFNTIADKGIRDKLRFIITDKGEVGGQTGKVVDSEPEENTLRTLLALFSDDDEENTEASVDTANAHEIAEMLDVIAVPDEKEESAEEINDEENIEAIEDVDINDKADDGNTETPIGGIKGKTISVLENIITKLKK